jgi:hypothetical protein
MNNSSDPMDIFNQVFGKNFSQKIDSNSADTQYVCNQCRFILSKRVVADYETELPRSLFYCTNKSCEHYGLLTVVAVKM